MIGFISILINLTAVPDFTGKYDITEVILMYGDTLKYKLSINQDEDSCYYHLDWIDEWDSQSSEIGFEFNGILGAYDFENRGLGVYRIKDECLVGFRIYPVLMKLLQVTYGDCQPLERCEADLSGFWNVQITGGSRRGAPARMNLNYREDGDYWDGGEWDADFNDVSGGWGIAAEDILVMGFQKLDVNGITLKMYEIKKDTLEGIWIEGYYDYETGRTVIESEGTERAVRQKDNE